MTATFKVRHDSVVARLTRMQKLGPVAIVGAGLSGLSCAQALRLAGVNVTLFERAARVGGRCATRLWQGHLVDHGVQYFTARTPTFKRELLTNLRHFRPIIAPILDEGQKIVHSANEPRFYVLQGNNYLAQTLARDLDVNLHSPVDTISFNDDGIEYLGKSYRAVISSLPAPQTARLFRLSQPATPYVCCLTALLEYSLSHLEQISDCYGRLVPEGKGPLMASYCENHKEGRIIGGKTVFVVQASSDFSGTFADAPPEEYLPQLIKAHEDLWRIPGHSRTASSGHRWRLGRSVPMERHPFTLPPGAFVCGDSCSESSVEDVWLDGRRAAEEVLAYLAA